MSLPPAAQDASATAWDSAQEPEEGRAAQDDGHHDAAVASPADDATGSAGVDRASGEATPSEPARRKVSASAKGRPRPPAIEPVRRLPNRRRSSATTTHAQPAPSASIAASGAHAPLGLGLPRHPHGAAPADIDAAPSSSLRPFINLSGDYRFLRAGYWALVDAELNGVQSSPTPIQAVTAQNAAACLLVAKHAGIETVDWKVARRPQDVEPPCLLVPVSGLTERCYEVKSTRSRASQWRSATQNGTRAALSVKLNGELRSLRMIVGVTAHENYHLAWDVWRTFGVPLGEIWYVEAGDPDGPDGSRPLFMGIDPLPLHELTERELRLYEEVSQRPMQVEPQRSSESNRAAQETARLAETTRERPPSREVP